MSSDSSDDFKVEGAEGRPGSSQEQARRDLEEAFNVQRARMKELFLQKEEDMRKMLQEKEQLESEVLGLRAELQQLQTLSQNQKSEIQSLQLLVNETVEASSSGSEEVRRLMARTQELEQQLNQLRQQSQEVSLAPATFVRSLARKLGADAEETQNKKPQNAEDSELRATQAIVQQLNDEIAALKGKLRDTDTQLQELLKSRAATTGSPAPTGAPSGDIKPETGRAGLCDMCANYEEQLVGEQRAAAAARERAHQLAASLRLATEELEGVRSLHDETVRSWQSERTAAAAALQQLQAAVQDAKETLAKRMAAAQEAEARALDAVTTLTVNRETLQKQLDSLERDNEYLIGQYTKHAAELQNEFIDLPDNVEELQELALRLREQLIVCAVGRERAAAAEAELRGQLAQHTRRLLARDSELAAARSQLEQLETERAQLSELGDKLRASNDLTEQLLDDKRRLSAEAGELRSRVAALQQDLDNSEKVQQDFVRLSQSLQVQLQRIREADAEVRWQHEEDVAACPACRAPLPSSKKKVHCRHCGRIFCAACVSHPVPSGPRARPARVCGVCRTLLQPHAAPYFSTEPPLEPA